MPALATYPLAMPISRRWSNAACSNSPLIDPGSVNFTLTKTTSAAKPAGTYLNPEDHVRYALDFAARQGLHPDFAIYEPGFTRAGAALARAAGIKPPVYRFMFCNQIAFGFPPKPYALRLIWRCWRRKRPARPG